MPHLISSQLEGVGSHGRQITVAQDETYKSVVGTSVDFYPAQNYLSFVIWGH